MMKYQLIVNLGTKESEVHQTTICDDDTVSKLSQQSQIHFSLFLLAKKYTLTLIRLQ